MIVCVKNFFRNEMSNITIRTVRHFLPSAEIHVLNLFKREPSEYDTLETLNVPPENIFFKQTKYISTSGGSNHPHSNTLFSEGYNYIFERFKDRDGKLLMLCEDQFFTSGKTLKELQEHDFDLGYGNWAFESGNDNVNGSFLCVKPIRVAHLFPIPEHTLGVEEVLKNELVSKIPKEKQYVVTTRKREDYCGDGCYTNDVRTMRIVCYKAGLISREEACLDQWTETQDELGVTKPKSELSILIPLLKEEGIRL